jgi:peptidyl-prolyl cis-trans isomerase C
MTAQAKYEMSARTAADPSAPAEGAPVARIGSDLIYAAQIDKAFAKLPPWMQKQIEEGSLRRRFIEEYISREVLYRKAHRLGLDMSDESREAVADFRKDHAINALISLEVEEKVTITPAEIEQFYATHKEKYDEPALIEVSYVEAADAAGLDGDASMFSAESGREVRTSTIAQGVPYVQGLGEIEADLDELFTVSVGDISDVLQIGEKYYRFMIQEKQDATKRTFDEVKERVQQDLRMQKQQARMQELLKSVLEEQEVEIYAAQ